MTASSGDDVIEKPCMRPGCAGTVTFNTGASSGVGQTLVHHAACDTCGAPHRLIPGTDTYDVDPER